MTISALPSLRQPESIDPNFYFTSQTFINKIKYDISILISTFKSNSIQQSSRLGPFLNFKSIYSNLGWNLIHLSVIDSSLRKVWFNTIIRLFLDYLKPEIDPIEQIASLFSIYTFWGTQSTILDNKFNVIIDTNMLNYIKSIPTDLGIHLNQTYQSITDQLPSTSTTTIQSISKSYSHLDPNLFSIPSTKSNQLLPSHTLYQIVTNLIQQNAFIIQPIETALIYPHLPTNQLILENNLNPCLLLQKPLNSNQNQIKISFSEQIISTEDELNRFKESNHWNLNQLREIRSNYLSKKLDLINHHSLESNSILSDAIQMTLKVIEKNAPGLNHVLDSNLIHQSESNQKEDEELKKKRNTLEVIRLVDNDESLNEWDEALNSFLKS